MLTVGILSDGPEQEHWIVDCVRRIRDLPGVSLSAVVMARGRHPPSIGEGLHRVLHAVDSLLRCRGKEALVLRDLGELPHVPVLGVDVRYTSGRWWLDAEACRTLRQRRVDLWLCAMRYPPSFTECDVGRYGAWGIEIGRAVAGGHPWAGAIEVAAGSPVTAITVRDYARQAGGEALWRSFSATDRYSSTRNRLHAVIRAGRLLERGVRALLDGRRRAAPPPMPAAYPSCPRPTAAAVGRLDIRLGRNVLANRLRGLWARPQWQIAYYFGHENVQSVGSERLRYLVPPPDRFWADPMPVEHDGRYFVFFEELVYRESKGRLMAAEVFEDRAPGEPRHVLERDYHLSYPFLFRWRDELYMIPETAERDRVELYRCTRFPDRWEFAQVLLDGVRGYDATLWEAADGWWMFVSIALPGTQDGDELHLYSADAPTGPWRPHPLNPVISDARYARPAGPLYRVGKKLYRPSQDCSSAYGFAISINRVDALNTSTYSETPVAEISPRLRDDFLCVHTAGQCGRLRVLDFLVMRPRLST